MACPECEKCEIRNAKRKLDNFKSNLRGKYNLSYTEWEAMVEAQDNKCAICKGYEVDGKRLSIDHDHKTGKNRGLLCTGCNGGLGLFKDNIVALACAIEYLEKHQQDQ